MKAKQRPFKRGSENISRCRRTRVLVLLCIILMGTGLQTAQAAHPDDPLPFNPNYKCEKSNWEALMCNVHTMMGFARKISSIYSDFKGAFNAATFLGQVLGILDKEVDLADELRKLHEHLDKLGAKLDERAVKREQANQLGFGLRMVETAAQNVRLRMPFDQNTDGVNEAAAYIKAATNPLYFERFFMESATAGETQGEWKALIDRRPATPGSGEFVYDWRVGIPHLMQLIALRLAILPVIDPHFAKDEVFKTELLGYRTTLHEHYDKMINSVRCNWSFRMSWGSYEERVIVRAACADVYTGTSAISANIERALFHPSQVFNECHPWAYPPFPKIHAGEVPAYKECLYKLTTDEKWASFINTTIKETMEDLRRQVLRKMPLFEMRSMIDMLFLYAHGVPDLTERAERIMLELNPELCLDVQWGNVAPGTPVWLWGCNHGHAQWWLYDRQSGTILNPASSLCLEVQEGNLAPGTPVQLGDCNSGDASKWTYDPEQRVLQGALGTVLQVNVPVRVFCNQYVNGSCASNQYYVDYDAIKAEIPVIAGVRTEESSQQWITFQPVTRPKCQEGMTTVLEERCDKTLF